MSGRKNANKETSFPPSLMDSVAERYLDLWQDNIRRWATDPDALEKWIREINDVNQ